MSKNKRGIVISTVFGVLLSLVGGCASQTGGLGSRSGASGSAVTEVPVPAALMPGNGLVAMGLASNTGGIDGIFLYWTGLEIRRVDNNAAYRISVTRKGLIGSSVFLGNLPPGEYRAERVVATDLGSPLTLPISNWGSSFRVEAGRLTNLGTLVFQPEKNDPTKNGARFYFALERNTSELGGYLRVTHPQLMTAVSGTALEWSQIDSLEEKRTLATRIRRVALGNYSIASAKDGALYTTAQFGTVRRRDPDGQWIQVDTGNTRRMISVCALADGPVLAGGEAGLLLRSDNRGRSWSPITAPQRDLPVFDLGQLADGSVYALSPTDDNHVLVHLTDARLKTPWRLIGNFALPPSAARITINETPQVVAKISGGKLMLFLAPQTLQVYVGGKTGWVTRPLPLPFLQVSADRDRRLYMSANKEKPSKNSRDVVLTSIDGGIRWNEAFTFNHTRESILFSGTGLIHRISSNVISESPYKTENRLSATNDFGKTWRDLGVFLLGYPKFVQTQRGTLLGLFANLVYSSEDAGAHWRAELEQFHPPEENRRSTPADRKAATQQILYCPDGSCPADGEVPAVTRSGQSS